MFVYYVIILTLGLAFGSFLSVIVSRLDVKKGIMAGRSECPKCAHVLGWRDLIPLISYVSLRGKCRYCKTGISPVYPSMELAMAGSFLAYLLLRGPSAGLEQLYEFVLIFIFIALIYFDYLYYILPDKIMLPGAVMAFLYKIFYRPDVLLSGLITGLLLASFFAIIYVISKGRWMGFGDVKLAFLIGLVFGYPAGLLCIIASVWLGTLWGVGLIMLGKANTKTALPFGTFIGITAVAFIILKEYVEIISLRF